MPSNRELFPSVASFTTNPITSHRHICWWGVVDTRHDDCLPPPPPPPLSSATSSPSSSSSSRRRGSSRPSPPQAALLFGQVRSGASTDPSRPATIQTGPFQLFPEDTGYYRPPRGGGHLVPTYTIDGAPPAGGLPPDRWTPTAGTRLVFDVPPPSSSYSSSSSSTAATAGPTRPAISAATPRRSRSRSRSRPRPRPPPPPPPVGIRTADGQPPAGGMPPPRARYQDARRAGAGAGAGASASAQRPASGPPAYSARQWAPCVACGRRTDGVVEAVGPVCAECMLRAR